MSARALKAATSPSLAPACGRDAPLFALAASPVPPFPGPCRPCLAVPKVELAVVINDWTTPSGASATMKLAGMRGHGRPNRLRGCWFCPTSRAVLGFSERMRLAGSAVRACALGGGGTRSAPRPSTSSRLRRRRRSRTTSGRPSHQNDLQIRIRKSRIGSPLGIHGKISQRKGSLGVSVTLRRVHMSCFRVWRVSAEHSRGRRQYGGDQGGADSVLRCGLTSGSFNFPEDRRTPMIMSGLGTGLAPFRAFAQESAACSFEYVGHRTDPKRRW